MDSLSDGTVEELVACGILWNEWSVQIPSRTEGIFPYVWWRRQISVFRQLRHRRPSVDPVATWYTWSSDQSLSRLGFGKGIAAVCQVQDDEYQGCSPELKVSHRGLSARNST
jgi:hypothetical protein